MIRVTLAIAAALGVLAALLALAGVPLRDVAVSFVEGTTGWIPDRGEFVGWQPNDFDRGRRQQEVIRTIFQKALQTNTFSKIPQLYNDFSSLPFLIQPPKPEPSRKMGVLPIAA